MGRSTFISAALHVAVLLWVIVAFPSAKMSSAPLVAIPVDLATQDEDARVKPAAPQPKAAVEQPSPDDTSANDKKTQAVPKPEKKAEAPPPPQPEPKPEKPARKPDAQAAAAPQAPQTPAPEPKAQEFDPDGIAALLDTMPEEAAVPQPEEPAEDALPWHAQTDEPELAMSVDELAALRARISECWTPPPGGLGAEEMVVKIRLKLNADGTLVDYPTIANQGASPFFQAAADSAVRAVYQCQPYALPIEKYALWRDMILNFDPSAMYRRG